jgi:hypothetical protein
VMLFRALAVHGILGDLPIPEVLACLVLGVPLTLLDNARVV